MKKIAIFAAMLVVFPSISLAFDPNDAWHPLSQIVKSSTNLVSVDANNDGIIDSAAFASAAGAAASVPWSGISGKPDYVSSLDQYVNTNSDVTHSILRVGQLCIGDDCKTAWPTTSSMSWSAITGKPTTVSGYGITDMALQSVNYASSAGGANSVPWSGITGNPFSYSGGNVGIGTTGPTAPLKVVGSNNPDGYSQILQVADSSDATKLVFVGYDSSNDYGILGAVDTGITFKALKIGPGNTYFTGNVGIGATNPNTKLDVQGDIEISAADIQLRGRIGSNPSCASGEKEIYRKWTAESFSWGCYGTSGGCSFPGGWGGPWSCSGAIYYPCDCPTGCTKHGEEFDIYCSCSSYRWTKVLCVGD
jgi:hypothetical protein